MSEQRTNGRLMVRGGYSLYAEDGTPVADTCLTNSIPANDEANARRLKACWNACELVPTELLERSDVLACLSQKITQLTSQSDELLKALREAMGELKSFHLPEGWEIYEQQSPKMKRWLAAIAACQAQPAVAHPPANDAEGGAA